MKRKNLISAIAFVFSVAIFMVSGAIYIHSAQQQTTQSTLNVAYVADNVSFTATAYYQLAGSNNTVSLVNTSDSNNTTLTFTPANTSTTKTLSATSDISLDVTNNYVLLTFAFTNTASNGGYCIKVSLTDGTTDKSNVNVTYLASSSSYTTTSAGLTTQIANVTSTSAPTDVYIQAQQTKYFYVLVEVDNLYVNSNYNSTLQNGLVWDVVSTTEVNAPMPVFETSGSTLTGLSSYGQTLTELVVPSDITTLGAGAFDNANPALTSLTIPSTVTSINATALQYVQYNKITLSGWTTQNKIDRLDEIKVAAGYYPQTVYYNNGSYTPAGLTATGKTYTTDAGDSTVILTEYSSTDGNKYAMLSSATYNSGFAVLNGSGLYGPDNTALYFKVEPIVVTIKTVTAGANNAGECYVLADNLLGSMPYDYEIANWYSSPAIRTYLNGTFRTDAGLTGLAQHTVHNNSAYAYENIETSYANYTNYDTQDYIWLPSYYEMKNGGGLGYSQDSDRLCRPTDFAIATNTNTYGSNDIYSFYFLRSAGEIYDDSLEFPGVCFMVCDGDIGYDYDPYTSSFGFRVAFAFNL